ncbi:MAG: putative lipid II flippase FtsW [Oscillospiraceae bacterium]|jgi:cell division protein FtsW|nr:putative lipid II flippase FtsW [Oscillospiraceae bacterium]
MAYAEAKNTRLRENTLDDDAIPEKRGRVDLPFTILVLILLSIGVVMVLSASYASAYYESGEPTKYFTRQLIFAVVGVAAMFLFSYIKMKTYRNFSMPLLALAVGLLIMVLFIGVERNHAKRWFDLGFTTFQPSEIAKIAVIMAFSVMVCKYGDGLRNFKWSHKSEFIKAFFPFAGVLGVIGALLLMEPHKSATIIIIAIGAVVLFAGGFDVKLVFLALGIAAAAAIILISKAESSYAELAATGGGDYAFRRIVFWLHPEADPSNGGYQVLQSLYAVGSGGLTGLGLGQSRQKYLYLPEEHNDYIFAIVCEELGFIGAALILVLFAMLIIRGFWIALHARTKFDALVAAGVTGMLAIQVFLNISVVTNFIPCTGISLPFFSYGGTALLMQLAEMGVILSVSRDMPTTRNG